MNNNFELLSNTFNDNRLIMIESLDCGSSIIVIWLKLLIKSKKVKSNYVYYTDFDSDLKNDLHILLNVNKDKIDYSLPILEKYGLIKIMKDHIILYYGYDDNRDRTSEEYIMWRLSVFKRDNFVCQECGYRGGELEAHHIIKWSDSRSTRFDLNNGITLCKICHKKHHRKESKNG